MLVSIHWNSCVVRCCYSRCQSTSWNPIGSCCSKSMITNTTPRFRWWTQIVVTHRNIYVTQVGLRCRAWYLMQLYIRIDEFVSIVSSWPFQLLVIRFLFCAFLQIHPWKSLWRSKKKGSSVLGRVATSFSCFAYDLSYILRIDHSAVNVATTPRNLTTYGFMWATYEARTRMQSHQNITHILVSWNRICISTISPCVDKVRDRHDVVRRLRRWALVEFCYTVVSDEQQPAVENTAVYSSLTNMLLPWVFRTRRRINAHFTTGLC